MFQRGGFSFVAMLVINPIVILFYQNCSFAPISVAKVEKPQMRTIASESKAKVSKAKDTTCQNEEKDCVKKE